VVGCRAVSARNAVWLSCVVALAAPALAARAEVAAGGRVAVRAAHLFDPASGRRTDGVTILVAGERVEAVGPGLAVPAGVPVIDLGGATVLPGLIDVHTHLTSQSGSYYVDLFRRSPIDEAVRAHVYARRTLEAGFTSVRGRVVKPLSSSER
jgi:imidazolonepropionase-like amidohydrolase